MKMKKNALYATSQNVIVYAAFQGLMYGTARFNAFVVASHADDIVAYDEGRDRAIEYFVGQYREMLISNLDDYRSSFEDLKYSHLMSRRPN